MPEIGPIFGPAKMAFFSLAPCCSLGLTSNCVSHMERRPTTLPRALLAPPLRYASHTGRNQRCSVVLTWPRAFATCRALTGTIGGPRCSPGLALCCLSHVDRSKQCYRDQRCARIFLAFAFDYASRMETKSKNHSLQKRPPAAVTNLGLPPGQAYPRQRHRLLRRPRSHSWR